MTVPERRPADDLVGLADITWIESHTTGLHVHGEDQPYEEWKYVAGLLGFFRDWTAWAIGDLLVAAEHHLGKKASQLAEEIGREPDTCIGYQRVARLIPPERRREGLSFGHHQAVAACPPEVQEELLAKAEQHGWDRGKIREAVRTGMPGLENRALTAAETSLLVEVAREILAAARPLERAVSAVSNDLLGRLANAVGAEWPPPSLRLIEIPPKSDPPEWA